ncbi:MAG: SIMPL domain-containing protein [Candidatus Kryptoniota bacterium]
MKTLSLILELTTITLLLASPGLLQAQAEITVAGEGKVTAAPDIAEFNISITRRNLSATEAYNEYRVIYDNFINSMKDIIAPEKIYTSGFSITPHFDYQKQERLSPDYYIVNTSVSFSIPVALLNKALERTGSINGIVLNGIRFTTKNMTALETEALLDAMKDAKSKAEIIAKQSGLSSLMVKNVTTQTSHPPIFFPYRSASVSSEPNVVPSDISFSANVTVTFIASYSPEPKR